MRRAHEPEPVFLVLREGAFMGPDAAFTRFFHPERREESTPKAGLIPHRETFFVTVKGWFFFSDEDAVVMPAVPELRRYLIFVLFSLRHRQFHPHEILRVSGHQSVIIRDTDDIVGRTDESRKIRETVQVIAN